MIAGVLIAAIGYWIGAVIAFFTMHGIPLGSPGGPPTRADVSVNLALSIAASFGGAFATVRIAGHRPALHALVLGVLLAMSVLAAFANAAGNWPAWFPYGMAIACAGGAVAAGQWVVRRSQ